MSVFGAIMSKIFQHPAAEAGAGGSPSEAQAQTVAVQQTGSPQPAAPQQTAQAMGVPQTQPQNRPAPAQQVDVEAVLAKIAEEHRDLNWRQSIVDLMKLLGLDSSLAARQKLADELGYTGAKTDSASMNIWLYKQVMQKLAENGGNVPASLRH